MSVLVAEGIHLAPEVWEGPIHPCIASAIFSLINYHIIVGPHIFLIERYQPVATVAGGTMAYGLRRLALLVLLCATAATAKGAQ